MASNKRDTPEDVDDLCRRARDWANKDFCQETKKEMLSLIDRQDYVSLHDRLDSRIAFGTAGLRAAMAAGPSKMNQMTVLQAAQGLCMYLENTIGRSALTERGISLGYDGRYRSKDFAEISAAVFLSRGHKVYLMNPLSATPLLCYSVHFLKTAAGVMVTASHNPKEDNGYKVYWSNACQIISPHDIGIADMISQNLDVWPNVVTRSSTGELEQIERGTASGLLVNPFVDVSNHYHATLEKHLRFRSKEENSKCPVKMVFTAMHGVGYPFSKRVVADFGLPPFISTPEQQEADPEFPTVKLPNPQEGKGALQCAMNTAEKHGALVIVANDPDADRFAAAEKLADGSWYVFHGNQIAVLLLDWMYIKTSERDAREAKSPKYCIASSIVSTSMVNAMAEKDGYLSARTLTGFKWMGNKAIELEEQGYSPILCFEEAIGYVCGTYLKDKDGVGTLGVFSEMTGSLYERGSTIKGHLDQLYSRYGYYIQLDHYFLCYQPSKVAAIFERMRNGGKYFDEIGGYKVRSVLDLERGYDSSQPDNVATLPYQTMITYTFENGAIVQWRSSGTEPKFKYYTEMPGKTEFPKQELTQLVRTFINELIRPDESGLVRPAESLF